VTDPKQPRAWNLDPIGNTRITPEQARRAALAVAAAYPDEPLVARHLLDILGLLHLSRLCHEGTSAHLPAPTDAAEPARQLVDTAAAAEALGMPAPALFRFADAGIVTPARVDTEGFRWWNLRDMRHQIAAYLDDHGDEKD
jgi:hypothetical protein